MTSRVLLLWLMLSDPIMIMLVWQCTHPESIVTRLVHLTEAVICFLPLELKFPFGCFGIVLWFSKLYVYGAYSVRVGVLQFCQL